LARSTCPTAWRRGAGATLLPRKSKHSGLDAGALARTSLLLLLLLLLLLNLFLFFLLLLPPPLWRSARATGQAGYAEGRGPREGGRGKGAEGRGPRKGARGKGPEGRGPGEGARGKGPGGRGPGEGARGKGPEGRGPGEGARGKGALVWPRRDAATAADAGADAQAAGKLPNAPLNRSVMGVMGSTCWV
jgi:hypothetical protein